MAITSYRTREAPPSATASASSSTLGDADDGQWRRRRRRKEYRKTRQFYRMLSRCALMALFVCMAVVKMISMDVGDDVAPLAASHIGGGRTLLDDGGLYPTDAFTSSERSNGGVIFHIIGVLYMFLALAIVCDDYFVPALEVITEQLDVDEDVAGATFMAAGGSAPELFTSFIGTFIAKSNVGFGTIVGSAIFNILFIVGACVFASPDELILRWWPLARDCTFYSVYLLVLLATFEDQLIHWWEALILLVCYGLYVWFMANNTRAEKWFRENVVKRCCARQRKLTIGGVETDVALEHDPAQQSLEELKHRASEVGLIKHGRISFHTGALRLMMSEIDPKGKGPAKGKETRLKAAARLIIARNVEAKRDNGGSSSGAEDGSSTGAAIGDVVLTHQGQQHDDDDSVEMQSTANASASASASTSAAAAGGGGGGGGLQVRVSSPLAVSNSRNTGSTAATADAGAGASAGAGAGAGDGDNDVEEVDEGDDEGLSYSCPDGALKRAVYVMLMPIYFPLYYTLPDCSMKKNQKYFAVTFVGSILWIGFYAYLMVWWATVIGEVFNIPPEVMGLTFLAAGTSVPDLLTSVIVARKGFGDMAVSSSVGSNIFDICVGLPFPWISYTLIYQETLSVGTSGLFISVIVLFGMLVAVVATIALNDWKLTKPLGYTMFVFYAIFLTQSLLVEYNSF